MNSRTTREHIPSTYLNVGRKYEERCYKRRLKTMQNKMLLAAVLDFFYNPNISMALVEKFMRL